MNLVTEIIVAVLINATLEQFGISNVAKRTIIAFPLYFGMLILMSRYHK